MDLAWAAVPGATRYHLELARTPAFQALVANRRPQAPHVTFRPRDTGTFAWRVAALDAAGHEGAFGEVRRFTVAALPGPKGATPAPATASKTGPSSPPVPLPALPLAPAGRRSRLEATVIGGGLTRQPGGQGSDQPLRGRARLGPHDVLAAGHSAGLRVDRGLVLGLEEGSRLEVEGTGRDKRGRFLALHLQEGAVTVDLGTRGAVRTVYLENAHARVALDADAGGGARVRASQHQGTLRVVAERGTAEVLAGGKDVKLPEGHGLPIPDGAAPGALVTLPDAPPLVSPRPGARFADDGAPPAIELSWHQVEGAIGYQVRISYDPQGTAVAYQGLSQSTTLVDTGLAPGTYFWTVRALDPRGFSSAAAPARRLMVTRPVAARPASGAAAPTAAGAAKAEPASPTAKPAAPTAKPAAPTAKPAAPKAKPTAAKTKPTGSPAKAPAPAAP